MKKAILFSFGFIVYVFMSQSSPSYAVEENKFGNDGMKFLEDTTVMFKFIDSHGWFKSELAVYEISSSPTKVKVLFTEVKRSDNGSMNDFLGSCGNTVLKCEETFTFSAGLLYTLGLDSGADNNLVFSTDSLNGGFKQFLFTGNLFNNETVIGNIEDIKIASGKSDKDYNDFNFEAVRIIPEIPRRGTVPIVFVVGMMVFLLRKKLIFGS